MAKTDMIEHPTPPKDQFGIKALAEAITANAFAEADKIRQAGLLPGNLIAKMMRDRPEFTKWCAEALTEFKHEIEDYYKTQIDDFIAASTPKTEK